MKIRIFEKILCVLIIAILCSSTLQVEAKEEVMEWYEEGYSSTIHESKKKLKMKYVSDPFSSGGYKIYDKQGYLTIDRKIVTEIEEHRYDDNGRLIKSIWRSLMDPVGLVTEYQINEVEKIQEKKEKFFRGYSSLENTKYYYYDAQGREISRISYNNESEAIGRLENVYNEMGKEILTIEYYQGELSRRTEKAYDSKGNLLISVGYDEKGQEIEKIENFYDEKGKLLVSAEYYGGELRKRTENWYDEKDNIIKELVFINEYNGTSTIREISYNEENIRKELIVTTKDNNFIKKESVPLKEYDQDGDLIAEYDLVTIEEYTCTKEVGTTKDYEVKISKEIENAIYYEYYVIEEE